MRILDLLLRAFRWFIAAEVERLVSEIGAEQTDDYGDERGNATDGSFPFQCRSIANGT